jgi:two-component system NtrC family sensor kinase
MTRWSGTARRLALGFGALIVLFAAAAGFALAGLDRIHGALARIRSEEEGVRLALELSSAVRDQYAHQAHTIIIGNESHLGFYQQAERTVLALTERVKAHAATPEERAWVEDIVRASGELDQIFRGRIVPAVVAGRRDEVRMEHGQAQVVVTRIQERSAQLVAAFEANIGRSRA